MFDAQSSELLRSAPKIYGIDPNDLPKILTENYAWLVSERIRAVEDENRGNEDEIVALLLTLAETYETIAGLDENESTRRASAFVSGSAYQVLSRNSRYLEGYDPELFGRDHIAASVAAVLLFLVAEQYPDAREAASYIPIDASTKSHVFYQILSESVRDLGKGDYEQVVLRAERRVEIPRPEAGTYEIATYLLYEVILEAIEHLATLILDVPPPATFSGRFTNPQEAFERVIDLSVRNHTGTESGTEPSFVTTYPGPQHMASLLLKVVGTLEDASIHKINPPNDVNSEKWKNWLRYRAKTKPVLWPNHREALGKGFHLSGNSAVMVLPTGAGKTTLAEVKIAGVLAQGKQVVFLAPTNALVEQLQYDLKEAFPEELIGTSVSSELDLIFGVDDELQPIEVMTPEKCLALLNFIPTAFTETGLLVFDECHMINPETGNVRRALDSMLCILAFQKIVPNADFLFLSAMIDNEEEFSAWIEELTGRSCIPINIVWKPSRQARGVITYARNEIESSQRSARTQQNNSKAKNISTSAERELKATPYSLFGLLHSWHPENTEDVSLRKLTETTVPLSGKLLRYGGINVTANANQVAAELAVSAAASGLKTIVFVNQADWTVSTARKINDKLEYDLQFSEKEERLWSAIRAELGEGRYSDLEEFSSAFPHSASLTPLEQRLVESLFKRSDGIPVIVATTTLSQGMNLPAQMAILAGDRRYENNNQEPLKSHELLNAAGRAGRAGHLANGIVLLIPGQVVCFGKNSAPENSALEALQSILPLQECCVHMTDPLQKILDHVQHGGEINQNTEYIFYRLLDQTSDEDEHSSSNNILSRSFAAYQARRQDDEDSFNTKVAIFKEQLAKAEDKGASDWLIKMATQSGISPIVLQKLYDHLQADAQTLPLSVSGWIGWLIEWLKVTPAAVEFCFSYSFSKVLKAVGRKVTDTLNDSDFDTLHAGLLAWIFGESLGTINQALGGTDTKCERARVLATSVAPHSFSFFLHIVAQVTFVLCEDLGETYQKPAILQCLATAVKKGFDSPEKVAYNALNQGIFLSRVEAHQGFNTRFPNIPETPDGIDYKTVHSIISDMTA